MNSEKLNYYAGIFDGEGYVGIAKGKNKFFDGRNRLHIRAAVAMTNPIAVLSLKEDFGGCLSKSIHQSVKHTMTYSWVVTSEKAMKFLRAIRPYCLVKASQIDMAFEFQKGIIVNCKNRKNTITISEIERRYEIRNCLVKSHGWASRVRIEKVANSVNAEMPTPSQASAFFEPRARVETIYDPRKG